MPTEFPDDGTIDELLRLAGVSTDRSAARRWLESALVAARGTLEVPSAVRTLEGCDAQRREELERDFIAYQEKFTDEAGVAMPRESSRA
jgi:hypothetical protein